MGIQAQHDRRSLASRLMHWCSEALQAATEADLIGRLDERTLQEIAYDCGLSADQLKLLAKAGPHSADELKALMLELNIDPAEVQRLHPTHFRDMQINCSLCESKDRCHRDLAAQVLEREYVRYCSNADNLAGLQHTSPQLMS